MLGSAVVVVVLVLVVAVLLVVCTVVPFVRAVDMAERRGFSTGRWGGAQLVLLAAGALLAYAGLRHTVLLLLPAALLCWAAPLLLSLLGPRDGAVGGYHGAHEG
jgi:hypothetical protein